jgi:hypothetical protein
MDPGAIVAIVLGIVLLLIICYWLYRRKYSSKDTYRDDFNPGYLNPETIPKFDSGD